MTPIQQERFKTLYRMVWGLPEERLSLYTWRSIRGGGGWVPQGEFAISCGTTACVIGWATAYPEFMQEGFTYLQGSGPQYVDPYGRIFHGWEAVQEFFGLNFAETSSMFVVRDHYKTKWDVLHALRLFMVSKQIIDNGMYFDLEEAEDNKVMP